MYKILFLIFTLVLREINCKTVTLSHVKWTDDKENVEVVNMDIQNNKTMSTEVNVLKELKKPIFHIMVYSRNDGKYTSLVDKKSEYCGLDKTLPPGGFLSSLFKTAFGNSNVDFKCPMKVGTYYLRDFEIPGNIIPAYIPDLIFKSVLQVTQDFDGTEKEVFKATCYGEIKS